MSQTEHCVECDEPTGNAGKGEDSLYYDGEGPLCKACYLVNQRYDNEDLMLPDKG